MVLQKKDKGHVRVGVCALLWAIWIVHNDFIFNKKKFPIFFACYFFGYPLGIHMWYLFQPTDDRHNMDIRCKRLAMVAQDCYI
jgi:hypothetical protein